MNFRASKPRSEILKSDKEIYRGLSQIVMNPANWRVKFVEFQEEEDDEEVFGTADGFFFAD